MKRFFVFVSAVVLILSMVGCGIESRQAQVRASLGSCERKVFYTSGGFQDYTDFGIYACSAVDLENNSYFAPITPPDREVLWAFLDDFEGWVDVIGRSDPQNEIVVHYAFDRSIVDTGDWFYIYEDPDYPKFGSYDIWFFDSQTYLLYYFHNNI